MTELNHTLDNCTANDICLGGNAGTFCGNCNAGLERKEYDVIRFSERGNQRVIRRKVSLTVAQAMCNDPETSSMTARKPKGCDGDEKMIARWHDKQKHWFYGYRSA